MTRSRLLPAAALLFAALGGACAPAPNPGTRPASSEPAYFGNLKMPKGNVFRFILGAEPEVIDPALATGQPDGRVIRLLFEGLTREHPKTLEPMPGQAYRWELSDSGRVYTFHLRPGIRWSNGRPVVAEDFRWSWLRVLAPETASRYSGLLAPIRNAEAFTKGEAKAEDVGIAAPDDSTLVITLRAPTAYFPFLTQFYTSLPAPREAVEKHGRRWTRPENVVNNGPFRLKSWLQNDRFVFEKNPDYWDAANVKLDGIVAYSGDDLNMFANLYKASEIDWLPSGYMPSQYIPHLRQFADFSHGQYQAVYYYSINVTRPPYDNLWVRRALNWAVDRDAIANDLLKKSRDPWGNFVPSGYPGYQPPPGVRFDPGYARECLVKAGYPGGKGMPKVAILFNTSEDHRRIAEAIQQMWKRELSIDVELSNQEWGSYLNACTTLQYDVARRSWIGDYLDPNTFLACFITGDGNNRSGWSSKRYDGLLHDAGYELDPVKRMAMLSEAEKLLLDESPVIPIYHYATNELVKPWVRGIHATALDIHPLTHVEIVRDWRTRAAPAAASAARGSAANAASARTVPESATR